MEREEWLKRYKQRLIEEYGLTEHGAARNAEDVDFDDLQDAFQDDPEGCADEEMLDLEDDIEEEEEEEDLDEDDDWDDDEDDDW